MIAGGVSWPEVVFMVVAVCFSAAMQVTAGFGFALLAVPLMALAIDTHDAVVVSTFLGLATSSAQAIQGRHVAAFDLVKRLTLSAVCGIPVGLIVFRQVDEHVLKAILGIGVLLATVLLARRIDLGSRGPMLDWTAGALSGALSASLSTNGPPLVFALQGRKLPIDVFRATINWVFCFSGVATLVAFAVSGEITRTGVRDAAISTPAMVIGAWIGFRLRDRINEDGARRMVLALLALAGVSALTSAFVG